MNIRAFKGMAKMGWKVALHYRFNFIISMITVPLSLLIYYFLWKSIFALTGQAAIKGFTFTEMINYYTLSMIAGFFLFVDIDKWMAFDIKHGHTVRDLLKPLDYFSHWLSWEIGMHSLGILIELAPIFAIGFVFFGLPILGLSNFAFFFISLFLGFMITFCLSFLLGLSAFWLKEITGLRRVRRTLNLFLSGGLVPLTFFPASVQTFFHYLPFEYMRAVPINIYLAKYPLQGILVQLALQALWVAILYIIIRLVWRKAFSKFAGAGT